MPLAVINALVMILKLFVVITKERRKNEQGKSSKKIVNYLKNQEIAYHQKQVCSLFVQTH